MAAVICLTLVFTVFVAKIVGCTLPILAKRVGGDPAVMASPFLTTIVDALSLIIYFEIAGVLLAYLSLQPAKTKILTRALRKEEAGRWRI